MKITFEASKSELQAAAKLIQFWHRVTQGFVPESVIREQDHLSHVNSVKTTISFSEKYMDDVVKLVDKFGIELASVIRGGMSIAMGVKGLVSAQFKEELNGIVDSNKPAVSTELDKEEPNTDWTENGMSNDRFAA